MNEGTVEETPWALVQRLRGKGSTFDEIIVALQERGLSRDDLEVLLKDDEASWPGPGGRPIP